MGYSVSRYNLLKINGVLTGGNSSSSNYIPNPSTYKVVPEDIDYNSERATDGSLHRNYVATKVKVSVSWDSLNASQVERIGKAIADAQFELEYYDPLNDGKSTATVYAGNKSFDAKRILGTNNAKWSVSFEMVEY